MELHHDDIWDIENFVLPALPKDERGSSYYWNLEKWV